MRNINKTLLVFKSIIYRIMVMLIQVGFTYLFTKNVKLSIRISVVWNLITMVLYYFYDYMFLSIFKIGERK
ncbi:MAG: DUF2061 domain-containing protein [Atribacterota bacterium]